VDRDATGKVALASAFSPRKVAPPVAPPPVPPKPPRPVHVAIPRVEITHAWVHGDVAAPRMIDADVNRLIASISARDAGVAIDVARTGLFERSLATAPISGSANFHLRAKSGTAPEIGTAFAGEVGAIEVIAHAAMEDKQVRVVADV